MASKQTTAAKQLEWYEFDNSIGLAFGVRVPNWNARASRKRGGHYEIRPLSEKMNEYTVRHSYYRHKTCLGENIATLEEAKAIAQADNDTIVS
jgi:hypothetical protein